MGKLSGIVLVLVAVGVTVAIAVGPDSEDDAWPDAERGDLVAAVLNGPTILWAVGDGADGSARAKRVAELIAGSPRHPMRLIYLGDVYESGTAQEYRTHYEPVYGRFAARTLPTPGNHEFANRFDGYIPYWTRVHGRAPAFYNARASGWQLLGLNSELDSGPASEQLAWLRGQLAKRKFGTCRIAFWHRPVRSAGVHGDNPDLAHLWRALRGRARVVLAGHDHDMQRHRPRAGIVAFVSGAGGHDPRPPDLADPRLAFGDGTHPGALRLRLGHEKLGWWFVSARGRTLDRGELRCRRGPPD